MTKYINFANSLKKWLKEKKYSITFFSKKLGISRNYLSQIINARKKPGKHLITCIEFHTNYEVKF